MSQETISLIGDLQKSIDGFQGDVHQRLTELERRNNSRNDGDSTVSGTPVRILSKGMKLPNYSNSPVKPSIGKAIHGIVTGDWSISEIEKKWTTGAAGQYLLAPEIGTEVIELVRPQSVVAQAGAMITPVGTANGKLPRITDVSAATWKAELDAVSNSTITIDSVDWAPKTLIATARVSRELFDDSMLAAQVVENALLRQLAYQLDYSALMGSGTTEPKGIFGTSGVNVELGANAALTRVMISNAVRKVMDKSFTPNALILNPRDYTTLDQLVEGNSSNQPLMPFPSGASLQKFVTAAIPINLGNSASPVTNTTSRAFVGDFSQLCFVVRQDLTVEVSTVSGDAFAKHAVDIKVFGRFDVAILQPGAFTVIRDLTA